MKDFAYGVSRPTFAPDSVMSGRNLGKWDEKKLESIELDDAEIQVTDEDGAWDYIAILCDSLPAIRNMYAHGGPSLHNQVRGTIEIVGEIINQIYPSKRAVMIAPRAEKGKS